MSNKTKEEIEQLAEKLYPIKVDIYRDLWAENKAFVKGYTQCQEDMADKDKWTFDEILDACYPTLGRGNDWATIAIRLKEQKANKQD